MADPARRAVGARVEHLPPEPGVPEHAEERVDRGERRVVVVGDLDPEERAAEGGETIGARLPAPAGEAALAAPAHPVHDHVARGPVPEEEYVIPLGVADVKREGGDVTLVTYSRMVLRALEAAELLAEEGIDVEVIDLRTLKPLDIETVVDSVKKTGRFVGVTEGYENTSFVNEVMAQVNELAFDWLDAPMERVAAANVPVPTGRRS